LGLIDKIQAYELGAAGRPLVALLVADNSDGAVDFAWDSEGIAALFPSSYTLEKLYLDSHPADAKPLLLSYLNGGSVFFNYVGHGARDLLSNSILLTNTTLYDPYVSPPPVHVDSLQNGDGLPVVTALTCAMGEFAVPGELGLSESMLLKPDGGAAAVWSATGLSDNAEAVLLNREFFSVAFGSGKRTLGDAVLEALKTYRLKGGVSFMAGMYGIIGDPGLEMP
jgi:hypothetical protein